MKTAAIFYQIVSLVSSLLLTNCSVPPNSILNLKPKIQSSDWYKGKEITTLYNDSITIRISFDRSLNKDYLFDVDITNNSLRPIIVEPQKFYYDVKKDNIQNEPLTSVTAKDPEKVILNLQKAYSLHQSQIQTQAMIYSFGYFLQFSAQTKALVTGDIELSNEVEIQGERMKGNQLIDDIQNQNVSESLDNSTYIWEILALRKTTLWKNESVSGKVFFPVNELAKNLEFKFPIGEYELSLLFNQTIVRLY